MPRPKTKLNKSSHCAYSIHLHFVFITKYRRKLINQEMLARLEEIFKQLCLKARSELLEFGGESDHVHLLIGLHPDNNISKFAGAIKAASSRLIRKEFSEIVNKFYRKPVFWSGSYSVISAGGAPLEVFQKYIRNQEKP